MSHVSTEGSDDDLRSVLPTPDSLVWRRSSDARLFLGSGYALLMQVTHPTVGAGVHDHSAYETDPFGRLIRTLDYVYALIYGGPEEALRVSRQMRAMHARITGTTPDGKRYHALEPSAFAWVHATLLEASVRSHAQFGRPMDRDETERFYVEWKRLGFVHGVRDRDLPATWDGFTRYFDEMVETRLEKTRAAEDLLRVLASPLPRPHGIPPAAWNAALAPPARLLGIATAGLLPPVLRARLGIAWSASSERAYRLLGATSRRTTPLLPEAMRVAGPTYLRLRRAL